MPTNRRRRTRAPIERQVPPWVRRLLDGEWPPLPSDEWDIGPAAWFLGDDIPGLPASDSPEGRRIWATSPTCCTAEHRLRLTSGNRWRALFVAVS